MQTQSEQRTCITITDAAAAACHGQVVLSVYSGDGLCKTKRNAKIWLKNVARDCVEIQ